MTKFHLLSSTAKRMMTWVFAFGLLMFSTMALSSMTKKVEGYRVTFTIIPSIMFTDHPKTHPARNMHRGVPSIPKYHIMLTIFDAKTNQRVKSAEVSTYIKSAEGNIFKKSLEPMLLNGTLNYGQYFLLNSYKVLHIEFTIKVKEYSSPFKVRFMWSTT